MQVNHLGILLKCRFRLSLGGARDSAFLRNFQEMPTLSVLRLRTTWWQAREGHPDLGVGTGLQAERESTNWAVSGWGCSMNSLRLTSGNWYLLPENSEPQAQWLGGRQQVQFSRRGFPKVSRHTHPIHPAPDARDSAWHSLHLPGRWSGFLRFTLLLSKKAFVTEFSKKIVKPFKFDLK